ncbi:hypothetical protein [Streptomyces jumonjinensis]|uniref:hypothetical protein n=1 Tax=Streptomyces jumonjinensis TaxID=1945 RepID=UPI00378AC4C7
MTTTDRGELRYTDDLTPDDVKAICGFLSQRCDEISRTLDGNREAHRAVQAVMSVYVFAENRIMQDLASRASVSSLAHGAADRDQAASTRTALRNLGSTIQRDWNELVTTPWERTEGHDGDRWRYLSSRNREDEEAAEELADAFPPY